MAEKKVRRIRRNKICFQLEIDEDGYPPFDVESLWVALLIRESALLTTYLSL